MRTSDNIVAILRDGPATTGEVAAEIGTTSSDACARLRSLEAQKRAVRRIVHQQEGRRGPKRVSMWQLPSNA